MPQIKLTETHLIIELKGYESILAIKRRLAIPLSSIIKVEIEKENVAQLPRMRIGGFSAGKMFYGRFVTKVGRGFFATNDLSKSIAIFTHNYPYKVVVIKVHNNKLIEELRKRIKKVDNKEYSEYE